MAAFFFISLHYICLKGFGCARLPNHTVPQSTQSSTQQPFRGVRWQSPCHHGHGSPPAIPKNAAAEGPEPGAGQSSELALCDKPGQSGVSGGAAISARLSSGKNTHSPCKSPPDITQLH